MADAWYGRRSLVLALALALIGFTGPSSAEEAEEAEQEQGGRQGEADEREAEPGERPAFLDEIFVTAQRRTQNVMEVPVSLTAIDAEKLDLLTGAGQDVKTLSGRVPSLVMESSFGKAFPRFYIRGLGNTDFDLNASQPVSMLYDEVVLENPILKGMPIFDIERVEVLRGPQGTLFGRNTPAGVVKFDSKKPSQEFDSFVRVSYGTFDTVDVKAAIGGALSETLSARFSGVIQTRSDWIDNRFTGENDALGSDETGAARVQLLWEPNDRFSGLLNLHAWKVDGTARIFRANIIRPGTDDLVAGFEQDEVFHDGLNSQDIDSQGATLRFDYDLGGAVLTSITGFETLDMFSRADIDGGFGASFAPPFGPGFIPFNAETADGIPSLDQLTQEIRIASAGERRLGWLVGAFYFDEDLEIETFNFDSLAPGNPQNAFAFQEQQAESYALFGSIDYAASERWDLQAGLRFTHDEKDFSAERPIPLFQTPTFAPIVRSTDADDVSWNLAAMYQAAPNVNVYGRVATGFRAPSIQGRILFCPDFEGGLNPATNCVSVADEEEILSFEIGLKSELLERRLRLGAAIFDYEVDGQQLVAVGGQFNTATLLNADKTDGYGFELDLEFAPTSEWLFTTGLSYNHTEIKDPNLAVAPCGGGCTVLDPLTPAGLVRVDGNSLPHAPEWIWNGIIDYRRPAGRGIFIGSVDWAYHDEKRFFLYESAEFRGDSLEIGLRLGYTFAEARYEVALFARNLLDEEIIQNGIDFNNLTGMTNDPRTVGIELVGRW
ncbi:MAG TPA: TonB-dependent receptor [Thermoanaerobaculia bacterium]|nr:TonB-dependent receptor [Thermoanaerobaculia bacterium]